MSNIGGFLREGWHPKGKDGGRESWRGDFKGINQVAGWVGKGKNTNTRSGSSGGSEHVSRPLATLKDPSAFGAPPKNVNFHGGAALPNEITPDTRRLGAPLSDEQIRTVGKVVHNPEDEPVVEQAKTAGPPLPYRANRTGLRTDKLPPPPLHRAIEGGTAQETGIIQGTTKAKPSLPPRLPPRRNSSNLTSPVTSSPPPPTYDSIVEEPKSAGSTYLSQGAVDRLGKAGISVPGLGIGQSTGAVPIDQSQSKTSPSSQLQGIQNRFSRMNSSPTSTSPPPISPPQGTTLAQKQSALRAAQAFHKDPSSVSLADAQSAASTANNFRERHQEQITAGAQKANSWNKKYNITGKVNSFLEQQASPAQQSTQQQALQEAAPQSPRNASQAVLTPDLSNRKPPPPPPPKKPSGMHGQGMGGQTPPPVPLGTKPSFG